MKHIVIYLIAAVFLLTACTAPAVPSNPTDEGSTLQTLYQMIDQEEAKRMMEQDDGHIVVDVRRIDEYESGHIPGAISIPNETIGSEMPKALPNLEQIILVYCRSGNRSKQAAEKLSKIGYSRIYEFGGILDWTGDIVTEPTPGNASAAPDTEKMQDYAGCYENGSNDTAIISRFDDEFILAASLYRLTFIEHAVGRMEGDHIVFHTDEEIQDPMTLSFYRDGETFTLRVEESTWEPMPVGLTIEGFVKTAQEAITEASPSDPIEQSSKPQGHYVFQPKVCSVYMEEVFGKDMCDAWFNLVDAVLAGEDTFACKDQHTYDWVMGQFAYRCLPVLPELIDYAYDREHSVKDGVASFTYLVPPEEAKQRIEEFGAQIEAILNDVFEDDYSDFEKALTLYVYFYEHYEYDYDTFEKMYETYIDELSAYRFFQTGMGVCQEISTAYSYLLMQAGVEATTMMGRDHQWSYIRLNGHNYHIDPTFVITERSSLAYFLMTDEQRELTGHSKAGCTITSNYAQDHPHPEYTADDDHFRPLWGTYFDSLSHETHTVVCAIGENEYGEWNYLDFDYAGY